MQYTPVDKEGRYVIHSCGQGREICNNSCGQGREICNTLLWTRKGDMQYTPVDKEGRYAIHCCGQGREICNNSCGQGREICNTLLWTRTGDIMIVVSGGSPPPLRFPPGAFPRTSPPSVFPPGQVPTRSFPSSDITHSGPPPDSYIPLRIQESALLKGELSPNIWTFLKVLQKEQALNEIQISQMMAGPASTPTTPPVPRIWTAYSTYS